MEKLYSSEDLIFDKKAPYRIFRTITRNEKMNGYSRQFYALNDYAYFISQSVNNRIKGIDDRMQELLDWLQNPNLDEETKDDFVTLYLGEQEDKNLWIPLVEQISINTIIMCLLSFYEGVLKEITYTFINKLKINTQIKLDNIDKYLEVIAQYDKNNLLKNVIKDKLIIKSAKKIRNMFVHEQWMTYKNNVWDFKTRKYLNKLTIIDLMNAITNILETIELIGIENKVYMIK